MSPRGILVFESTLAGSLDHGTARIAGLGYGAEPGNASGMSGDAYGIPTTNSLGRPLPIQAVIASLDDFLGFARLHPDSSFRVTSLGQNLGPVERDRVVEHFRAAPANCQLPGSWLARFGRLKQHRLLIGGGGHALGKAQTMSDFDDFLRLNAPLWGEGPVELVSNGTALATVAVDRYAKMRALAHRVIPANEARYGAHAALARDCGTAPVWYASRVPTRPPPATRCASSRRPPARAFRSKSSMPTERSRFARAQLRGPGDSARGALRPLNGRRGPPAVPGRAVCAEGIRASASHGIYPAGVASWASQSRGTR